MELQDWISEERFHNYLRETNGNYEKAIELYRWNASISSALFEVIHHFEVLLRNKITVVLTDFPPKSPVLPGSPWLDLSEDINKISRRLQKKNQNVTAGKIYSNLTFGAWVNMFVPASNDELWRQTLRHVMPHAKIERKVAASFLQSINDLRNRVAHHASLLDLDPLVEYKKIIQVARWIDHDAAVWIESATEGNVQSIASQRHKIYPIQKNVMLVPAGTYAWPLYNESKQYVYICPEDRKNQQVEYISFYADGAIQKPIAKILDYLPAVHINERSARALEKKDKKLSSVIKAAIHRGFATGIYQMYILSGPNDPETVLLESEIVNLSADKRHGASRGKRYLSLSQLSSAESTLELFS